MQHTAVITLMYLMFGQFLILTFGAFILWWVGDFGNAPFDDRRVDDGAKPRKVVTQITGKPSDGDSDGLPALAQDDHSIQPQVPEPIERGTKIELVREGAGNDEKTLLRSVS